VAERRTGTILPLPAEAQPPFDVYVNGVQRTEGTDYTFEHGAIRFVEPLEAGRPEGLWQKLVMSTAGIGYYNRGDSIDVHFKLPEGGMGVLSGKRVEPTA
jgi:hypothetical protein